MNEIYLQVENQEQVDRILAVLQEAEEQGELDFPFTTRTALSEGQDLREALAEASISIACALDEAPSTEDLEHIQSKITEVENLMAPIKREDLKGW
tara:strand:- start:14867 stop:15154 length:288 start_codon:yes stop_codon:yes gene_type:complete